MRLRVDTQVLEGPNIGDIRSLLNMLLAVDTQVLEGPDIGDIRSLPNMLLVVNELWFDTQVLDGPNIGDIGSPSTCCWSNTDRCSVARVCSFV